MKLESKYVKTQITRIPTELGESIEEMVRRQTENNEPIDGNAPMIYTEKAKGVMPEYDMRTDRQELALEATDKFSKSERAKTTDMPDQEGEQQETEKTE